MAPTTDDAAKLIADHIEPHPYRVGDGEARVKERGIAVWALIGSYLLTDGPDAVEQVADLFAVEPETVRAAIAYYEHHRAAIDARIAANAA